MAMFFCNTWIAFITDNIARDVIRQSKKKCSGCKSKLGSPLLHTHIHHSLLNKLESHFEETQGYLIKNLPQLYDQFKDHLTHSDDLDKDRVEYIDAARNFILQSNCYSIFYGHFVNEAVDPIIKQGFQKPRQPAKKSALEQTLEELFGSP